MADQVLPGSPFGDDVVYIPIRFVPSEGGSSPVRRIKANHVAELAMKAPLGAATLALADAIDVPGNAIILNYEGRTLNLALSLQENAVSIPAPSRRRQGAKVDLMFDTLYDVMHQVKMEELSARQAEEAEARRLRQEEEDRLARENFASEEERRQEEARLARERADIDFDDYIAKYIGQDAATYHQLLANPNPDLVKPRHFLKECTPCIVEGLQKLIADGGTKVTIVKAFENHNSQLWDRYSRARASLQGAAASIQMNPGKTAALCEDQEFLGKFDASVNELPLWHGTGTAEGAYGICDNGFDIGFVGSACGTAWGHGFYFADTPGVSIGYARVGFSVNAKYSNIKILFLCRVLCGNIKKTETPPSQEEKERLVAECLGPGGHFGPKSAYHSILGASWAHVCAHNHQVYPNYVILFRQ